jgi:hypothetical protein
MNRNEYSLLYQPFITIIQYFYNTKKLGNTIVVNNINWGTRCPFNSQLDIFFRDRSKNGLRCGRENPPQKVICYENIPIIDIEYLIRIIPKIMLF